jgi:hypothetical protein
VRRNVRDPGQVIRLPDLHAPPAYHSYFCSTCGSQVPSPEEQFFEIAAGLFDDDFGIRPDRMHRQGLAGRLASLVGNANLTCVYCSRRPIGLAFLSREKLSTREWSCLEHPDLPHVREASTRSRGIPLVRGRGRVRVQGVWRVQRSVGDRPTCADAIVAGCSAGSPAAGGRSRLFSRPIADVRSRAVQRSVLATRIPIESSRCVPA